MSGRVPAYRDPVLHFDALRLAALREGVRDLQGGSRLLTIDIHVCSLRFKCECSQTS